MYAAQHAQTPPIPDTLARDDRRQWLDCQASLLKPPNYNVGIHHQCLSRLQHFFSNTSGQTASRGQ